MGVSTAGFPPTGARLHPRAQLKWPLSYSGPTPTSQEGRTRSLLPAQGPGGGCSQDHRWADVTHKHFDRSQRVPEESPWLQWQHSQAGTGWHPLCDHLTTPGQNGASERSTAGILNRDHISHTLKGTESLSPRTSIWTFLARQAVGWRTAHLYGKS